MDETQETTVSTTLQEQIEQQQATLARKFGTFSGVFTPTLLTILGVIMYLREGWVVGNAGLLGAFGVILLAIAITTFTGLSMSSITTNIRIGAGGAFSIIAQSLGLEIGGSVGIPLYLSQALVVAMYIFGFREGWLRIFPQPPPLAVDLITFAIIFVIAYLSAGLAFRIQYVIMAVIFLSLVSVFGSVFTGALQYQPTLFGTYPGSPENGFSGISFWGVFAVFFPAATGIMAGANMSGELKNARRSIPIGTLSAIALSTLVYLALAVWLSMVASPEELVSNYTVMIDKALVPSLVLAGLLGATFSSGLSSLVGAPRILQAISLHGILPGSRVFAKTSPRGEPRNALMVTGVIVLAALFLRNLNAITPLITMFFLITYAMINVVVLIEQSLGLISFRPLLRIPRAVPLLGTVGCIFTMFIINPVFSLVAVSLVLVFYALLIRRQLRAPYGDMRSGLFVSVAEWAAKRVSELPQSQERAWKPNLLVPVEWPAELRGLFQFLFDLTYPRGSIKLIGLLCSEQSHHLELRLPELAQDFRDRGVYTTYTLIGDDTYGHALKTSIQALRSTFFRPNILFLLLPEPRDDVREKELIEVICKAREQDLGILLLAEHPKAQFGRRELINVWVRDQSPNWQLSMQLGNIDLALLSAYMIRQNWHGHLRLTTVVREEEQVRAAEVYLRNLIDLARLTHTDYRVEVGDFAEYVIESPAADLQIFGFPEKIDLDFVRRMVKETRSTCLFVRDSGAENVFA